MKATTKEKKPVYLTVGSEMISLRFQGEIKLVKQVNTIKDTEVFCRKKDGTFSNRKAW